MLVTLLVGYASASFLGVTGYFLLGGAIWKWGLLVWIGGAAAALLVAGIRLYLRRFNGHTVGAPTFAKSSVLEYEPVHNKRHK